MEKLTIKDIAKLARVSPSSVSIVINGKKGVSDKTRAKVLDIIEKMQYTPNPSSRRLVLNKTNNIAVLFNKDTHPLNHLFHSELNSIIVSECKSRGYNLVFTSAAINNDIVQLPNVIRSHDVDGVIFYGDPDPLIENALKQHELPYISVDSHLTSEDKLSVRADYETAAYVAVKYLVELGHTKIAFIGNHALQYHYAQTFSGFTKVLDEQDIKIPVNWIQFRAYNEEAATMCMDEILHGSLKPTAVFCSADIYAIGAMKSIKKHNLKIPQDISIIGIDDILLCQYVSPTLTTIKIDKHKMGKVAVDLIIDRIENHNTESRVLVASTLVVRESTSALSNS